MNALKCRAMLHRQRYLVSQLRKFGNLSLSSSQLVPNPVSQTTNSDDGIHIFPSKGNDLSMSNHTRLACGYGFTVLTGVNDQYLVVTGVNSKSQLGIPSFQKNVVTKLTEVKLPFTKADSQILDMSCGRLHTVVLTTEGLFSSGCNRFGQCGLEGQDELTQFTKIPSTPAAVKQVVCGLDHTLLLTDDGQVWSCGWGADGQTGLGSTDEQRSFALVQLPSTIKIATKVDSCLALTNTGEVFSWGNSEYSQLGFATEKTLITKPTKITSLQSIVDFAIGNSVGLALTENGDVFIWGYGLLGDSPEPCLIQVPQKLTFLDKRVTQVDCGLCYYLLLTDDKKVYIWGKLNQAICSHLPKEIKLPETTRLLSCGVDHLGIIVDT
ncbi:RCC1-like G exchanging factor-like protein [Dendronephthya gigantea]|uniref:RCC1-like G exchanging factor-like protein n=1 Tax=Dendronephthya gigantea TaxID=151771 RepID=UPI00106B1450|nr:RCC1-like G exchanging factor-like protein [Dendronephthya gigantea]